MTLKNNRAPILCCFKLCASFHSHQWIQTGVTVRKCRILVKIDDFLAVWTWKLMEHQALWIIAWSYVNSNWSYGPETAELVFFTSVTLTFNLWPWPYAWTSLLSLVITPENFMIQWWEHGEQERLKRRNTLGCLDQYAAQNSKYARRPIPSQPPTQKVFFQWYTQYDPTMKHSHCATAYAKELFQWLCFELVHSLRIL